MKATCILFLCLVGTTFAFPEHLFGRQFADPDPVVKHWALLVAGSNGWYNYRHQADICHAYQILHKHGIPDEQIVVMMYDDIANNEENPNKGVIINKPNGPNVYPGVPKDYTAEDVTPENFLALLQGEKPQSCNMCSGKTLKSDSNDHLFVYFADHGGTDLIAFPDGELEKNDLMNALKKMHRQQKFGKLVFYLEACESGSMFDGMSKDLNIFATTAANPDESSWGYYCNNSMDNCLGDEYSIHWMEDSDVEDLSSETLDKQFHIVKQETKKSHPQEYGNLTMSSAMVNQYQASQGGEMHIMKDVLVREQTPISELDFVPSREVEMTMLYRRLMKTTHPTDRDAILKKIMVLAQTQRNIIQTMRSIIMSVTSDPEAVEAHLQRPEQLRILDSVCYHSAVKLFSDTCFRLGQNDYAMGIIYAFANMCNENVQQDRILNAIKNVC
ncbi:legumain-like [Lytechinus pictus]|uniref:legumain-like n=1 Tax=Lytechinus pictus TaxID=7653 RepID=UPI0030BA19AC